MSEPWKLTEYYDSNLDVFQPSEIAYAAQVKLWWWLNEYCTEHGALQRLECATCCAALDVALGEKP